MVRPYCFALAWVWSAQSSGK